MSFSVKITRRDLFFFNMYHSYTHSQGLISIVLGVLLIVLAVMQSGRIDITYSLLYGAFGVVVLVYIPVTLWLRAGTQTKPGTLYAKEEIHYTVTPEQLEIRIGEQSDKMSWDAVYKLVNRRSQLLIYTNRITAFIIPKRGDGKEAAEKIRQYYKEAEIEY